MIRKPFFQSTPPWLRWTVPAIAAAGLLFLLYAWQLEPRLLRERQMTVEVPATPQGRRLRVAFFSDLHLGRLLPKGKLEQVVEAVNRSQCDLVLFGGDLLDSYRRDAHRLDLEEIGAQLARIQAPLGKYAVWGNHDYGGGGAWVYRRVMERGGFTLLKNSAVQLGSMELYGADDLLLGRPQLPQQQPEQGWRLVLTHEPDLAAGRQLPGTRLLLCGHSHGGQINLPVLTRLVLPRGARTYVKGWYPAGEEARLLVSSGVGMTQLPLRFGNPPEIILLELVPAGGEA